MKPTFKLHSPETGTDYSIYVNAPRATKGAGPWPVVLFTDGDDQFTTAVAAYKKERAADRVPALILVGVGYGAVYAKPQNRRGRDYTPVAHSDEPSSGGADIFLDFIRTTLWPELARRYHVHASVRGIGGHSLGSLFVLHALFHKKPFFTHHLASAPSIWWADGAMLGQAKKLRTQKTKLPARLFLSVGENDSESMAGDLTRLEQQLIAKPFAGLDLMTRRFVDKNHFNVLPIAFGTGLGMLFASRPGE
ncbi:MAG: alpha/beta hydrolase [Undibacterium sp.]|nr:alpha/beta hydrolase [Opitutaceae bacterium]